jgi:hypothetical protein
MMPHWRDFMVIALGLGNKLILRDPHRFFLFAQSNFMALSFLRA